jgi:TonB family protein
MNRLQKKCLITSAGFHGLLLLILIFGAALMPGENAAPANRITFFDVSKITDGPTHGGSSGPQAALPPPAPMTPALPPLPAPVSPPSQPQPQPAPVRRATPVLPDAPSFTPVKPKTTAQDDFTPVEHPPVKQVASNNQSSDAKARAQADNQRRMANQISRDINRLRGALSKDTAVEMSSGADGGEPAANYRDIVASMYTAAWNPPASLNDESATVVVSVTIARDGHVISHEILKPSGNADMDKSIGNTLENVSFIAPFPEGSKDEERTYSIKFNLSAKRSLG